MDNNSINAISFPCSLLMYPSLFPLQPNAPPANLNLLTCQVKRNPDEKKCFDLISRNVVLQSQHKTDINSQPVSSESVKAHMAD